MKAIQHIVFWIVAVVVLTIVFGRSYQSYSQSFYFVSMLLPVAVGTAYFFNYFLVPKYLLNRSYFKFGLYCFYLLVISLNLEMYVITASFIILAEYNYANMTPLTSDIIVLTITLYCIVFCFAFMRLVKFYFRDQNTLSTVSDQLEKSTQKFLVVKENRQNKQIPLDSITHIESLGDYVKIHTESGKQTITYEKISYLADRLPNTFIRIHRAFLVNQYKISSFKKDCVKLKDIELPISRTYKKAVMSLLEENAVV